MPRKSSFIKNNLQVISSLLNLRLKSSTTVNMLKDLEFLEAFRERQDHVTSIALIQKDYFRSPFQTILQDAENLMSWSFFGGLEKSETATLLCCKTISKWGLM